MDPITLGFIGILALVLLVIIGVPVAYAQAIRARVLARGGQPALDVLLHRIGPWSIAALLATLVLLFAFQGEQILRQPMIIAMLAVPILIQVFFNYWRLGAIFGVLFFVALLVIGVPWLAMIA